MLDKAFTSYSKHTTIKVNSLEIDVKLNGFDILPEHFYPKERREAIIFEKVWRGMPELSVPELRH